MRSYLFTAVITSLALAAPARADEFDKYLPENAGFYVHVNINRLLRKPRTGPSGPRCSSAAVTSVTPARSVSRAMWMPVVTTPGPRATQEKRSPGTSSVTSHTVVGSHGWRTRARDPTRSGPSSSRSMLVTLAVQSGQRSTSA